MNAIDPNLIGILVAGHIVAAISIYYLSRAVHRRRLFSALLSEYSSSSAHPELGTIVKKESKSIWEVRSEDSGWYELTGITPVEEIYRPFPIAPFNLFVCYEAPKQTQDDDIAPSLSSSSTVQRKEFILKKIEDVSKKRYMDTKPGDLVRVALIDGKKRSGTIIEELRWSRSVAFEDMVFQLCLLLLGAGLYTYASYFMVKQGNYASPPNLSTPAAAFAIVLTIWPGLFFMTCFSLSSSIHQRYIDVLGKKIIRGEHDTSKCVFSTGKRDDVEKVEIGAAECAESNDLPVFC